MTDSILPSPAPSSEWYLTALLSERVKNYEKIYKLDDMGQEQGPQARIWNVYLDEAELYDKEVLEGYSGSTDILLVFVSIRTGS